MAYENIIGATAWLFSASLVVFAYLHKKTKNEVFQTVYLFMLLATFVNMFGFMIEAIETIDPKVTENLVDMKSIVVSYYGVLVFFVVFMVGMILFYLIKKLLEKLNDESSKSM